MTSTTAPVVRRLGTPAALALADLAATFEDLQTVLRCCERLVSELEGDRDELLLDALWTTAVLAYARCFAAGARGTGLTEQDVTATGLAGDVLGWHRALLAIRSRQAKPAEDFSVGVAQDASGSPDGIAVTSPGPAVLDDVSVRQTGAIAYALTRIVDGRIGEQQQVVRGLLADLSRAQLDSLPVLEVAAPQ